MFPHGHCHLDYLPFKQHVTLLSPVTKLWRDSEGALGSLAEPTRTSPGPWGLGDTVQHLESQPGDKVASRELHCNGGVHKTHSVSHAGWSERVGAHRGSHGIECRNWIFLSTAELGYEWTGLQHAAWQLSHSWRIFHFSKSKFSCRVICNIFN